ncbi:hypothetical protein [Celeribacter halophilus]|uniref:hypothetical protein n=1 Tax=Celeribacter halophilus TaxID=576117 RepID=UPI003A94C84A
MISAADHSGATFSCATFGKLGEKGVTLDFNSSLQQFPSAFVQDICQRVSDRISTGEINDSTAVYGGASLNGRLDVLQHKSN